MRDKVLEVMENFCDDSVLFTSLDVSNKVKEDFPSARHREIAEIVREYWETQEWYFINNIGYDRILIEVELLNGMKAKTYLYHPNDMSPDNYTDRKQVPIVPKPTVVISNSINNNDGVYTPANAIVTATFTADAKVLMADGTCKKVAEIKIGDKVSTGTVISSLKDGHNHDTSIVDAIATNNNKDEDDDNSVECLMKADGRLEIPIGWVKEFCWRYGDEIEIYLSSFGTLLLSSDNPFDGAGKPICKTTITPDGRCRVPKTAFMKVGFDYSPMSEHTVIIHDDYIEVEDSE